MLTLFQDELFENLSSNSTVRDSCWPSRQSLSNFLHLHIQVRLAGKVCNLNKQWCHCKEWQRRVYDCYLVHSASLNDSFCQKFRHRNHRKPSTPSYETILSGQVTFTKCRCKWIYFVSIHRVSMIEIPATINLYNKVFANRFINIWLTKPVNKLILKDFDDNTAICYIHCITESWHGCHSKKTRLVKTGFKDC